MLMLLLWLWWVSEFLRSGTSKTIGCCCCYCRNLGISDTGQPWSSGPWPIWPGPLRLTTQTRCQLSQNDRTHSRCYYFTISQTQITEPMKEERKKNKKREIEPRRRKGKKEEGKNRGDQTQEEKKKVRLVLFVGPSCVFNYKNVIELWVIETENNQNVFSVSITHNSMAFL